jgi:SAM-dependent methyltransferase
MLIEIILFITQSLLLGALLVYIGLGVTWCISGFMDVPFVPTPKRLLPIIANALEIRAGDVVYDLGCGDGRLLFYCAHHFPNARFVGIERNPILTTYAKIKRHILGVENLTFRRANVFATDFSDATRAYTFLLTPLMNKLFPPGYTRAKPMRLVSRAFKISGKESIETITLPNVVDICGDHLLHVYEF